MNGPEDCGKVAGDGKALSTYKNWWIFDGMAGNGMVLDCTPVLPDGADACSFMAPEPPSCATLGVKPKSLVFMYSGGGCSESNNEQPVDKAVCTALPAGSTISGPIKVLYAGGNSNLSSDKYVVEPTSVAPGGTFTVSWNGADLKADSYIKICNESMTICELNKIHTSCSQPLAVNDVFGSLTLVGFNGKYAGAEVQYLYEIKNTGSGAVTITSVLDDKLGELLTGPITISGGGSTTIEETAIVTGTTTNTVTVFAGQHCTATDSVTVTADTEKCLVIIDEEGVDNDFYSVIKAANQCLVSPDELVNDSNWLGKYGYDPNSLFPTYQQCQEINETNNGGKTLPTKCGNPPLLWNLLGKCPGPWLMPTGQRDDEGWFAPPPPATVLYNNITYKIIKYADTRPSTCDKYSTAGYRPSIVDGTMKDGYDLWIEEFSAGLVRQECLDKVKNVMPLRNQDLIQLVGKTCTAIVYDSDISINYKPLYANLQGERYGKFTFKVEAAEVAGSLPESKSDTSLYDLWLRVLPPANPTTPMKAKIHDHEPATAQVTKVAISTKDASTKKLTIEATSTYAGDDKTPPYMEDPSSMVNDPNSVYNTPKLPTARTDGDDKTYLTVSVDNSHDKSSGYPDTRWDDAEDDPYIREVRVPYKDGKYRVEIYYPSTVDLKGRRLSIQGDEGGIYNVIIP
jgi:hypothetical protein